jgi:hypothetical protein
MIQAPGSVLDAAVHPPIPQDIVNFILEAIEKCILRLDCVPVNVGLYIITLRCGSFEKHLDLITGAIEVGNSDSRQDFSFIVIYGVLRGKTKRGEYAQHP